MNARAGVEQPRRSRYGHYRSSCTDYLGYVPSHWHVKRLKFACDLINEKTDETPEDGWYVALENVQSGTGTWCESEIKVIPESQTNRFERGDVLFGKLRPYLAKTLHADRAGYCSTEFLVLRGRDVLPEFLQYWCLSRPFVDTVDGSTFGSKMPRASWEFVGNLATPIPEPREQRSIAQYLDGETARVDRLIAKRRRMIELLQEKRAALITHAATRGLNPDVPLKESGIEWLGRIPEHWRTKPLKHITTMIRSGKTPSGGAERYVDKGIPLIRSQNVHFGGLRLDDVVFIDEEMDRDLRASRLHPGDVLLNITGASIGRCCVFTESVGSANVNQHVCAIRPRRKLLNSTYLAAFLSCGVTQWLIKAGENGTSREGLNFEQIGSFVLPLPPRNEQKTIAARLLQAGDKLTKMEVNASTAIATLTEYRSSLITAAVTGQIDVRAFAP